MTTVERDKIEERERGITDAISLILKTGQSTRMGSLNRVNQSVFGRFRGEKLPGCQVSN